MFTLKNAGSMFTTSLLAEDVLQNKAELLEHVQQTKQKQDNDNRLRSIDLGLEKLEVIEPCKAPFKLQRRKAAPIIIPLTSAVQLNCHISLTLMTTLHLMSVRKRRTIPQLRPAQVGGIQKLGLAKTLEFSFQFSYWWLE